MSEWSRPVRPEQVPATGRGLSLEPSAAERGEIAERLGLIELPELRADVLLERDREDLLASGTLRARAVQACSVTGEPVEARIEEGFELVFRDTPPAVPGDEVELHEGELEILPFGEGGAALGEALADTLGLALPPYPRAAHAEEALREAGVRTEEEMEAERRAASPFAVLKGSSSPRP